MLIADAILLLHFAFVAFVVLGLAYILTGKLLAWSSVRNRWFRLIHLASISVVVVQSWLGVLCPLTNWEMALRAKAGGAVYSGTFISHWLQSLLYYAAPSWVFVVGYTAFGILVIASWFWVHPRPFSYRN